MWDMVKGDSVLDRFKLIKAAGFDGVEMNSPNGPPNDQIKQAAQETGVLIEGMVDSDHWKITLSPPNPDVRDSGLKALEQALRDCKELGGTSVLLVPGVVNANVSYDDCYQRSQEQIRKAIPLARDLGVKIAIEDVWNDFLLSPLEAARYVDEFDAPDAVGWHMDIGNVMAFAYPEQWIKILGKRIVKLHAKGFSRKKFSEEGRYKAFDVKLDEGDIDWKAVMAARSMRFLTRPGCAPKFPGADWKNLRTSASGWIKSWRCKTIQNRKRKTGNAKRKIVFAIPVLRLIFSNPTPQTADRPNTIHSAHSIDSGTCSMSHRHRHRRL